MTGLANAEIIIPKNGMGTAGIAMESLPENLGDYTMLTTMAGLVLNRTRFPWTPI